MRTRHGITFGGLILSGGAGVYLGAALIGAIAVVAGAIHDPRTLIDVPALMLLGAGAGAIVARATRDAIKPRLQHRYRRGMLTGAIILPLALGIGQLDHLAVSHTATQWAGGVVLLSGVAGIVTYYRWRKRRTLNERAAHRTHRALAPYAPSPR
ncbi:hypothetical protein [Sciscionella marina]|uniref:hypothetical protein n=1 Tax=Sciscionella marina TaxID=508770 RepID=UPI00036C80BF|nr:hypothetical protein [Sciscionella marina]